MVGAAKNLHILVFPYPAQGHMLPMLDLTHQLALQDITITILVTPKNLAILNPLLSIHPSIETLVFPFPEHPKIPSGVENVKDIGNHGNGPIISALSKLHDPIMEWFKFHPSPPVAILSDFFLGWTQDLAQHIGIPRIVFYSSGTFLISIFHDIWRNIESVRSMDTVDFPVLPRSPSFNARHLPSVFRRYKESDPDWQVVRNGMLANTSSWGSVFNTFDALEGEYSEFLKKMMGHERVFSVGPLNLVGLADRLAQGNAKPKSSGGILNWLDQSPHGSVLYVCFGSQKFFKKDQMEALAAGLEQSGVRFVWVVKPVTAQQVKDGYGSVPDGFEESVAGRGLVVKGWAPQVSILNHPAVGGFLSHCGWNSVLEAIVAGVMIMGWPMEADQFVNERLLVDYTGAAVRVCEGPDTVPDSAELARTINESMNKDILERIRAKQLKDQALEAVGFSGSSSRDMDGLVSELVQLTSEKQSKTKEMVPKATLDSMVHSISIPLENTLY